MAHQHDHGPKDYSRAFAIGVALNLAYVVVEVVYGLIAHSLALVADAGHNLSDVLGLLLAWGATWLVRRRPTTRRSYGFRRSSVLAALFNAIFLLIAVGAIAWEAISRLSNPTSVAGTTVIWVAAFGIVVNGATALLFLSGAGSLTLEGVPRLETLIVLRLVGRAVLGCSREMFVENSVLGVVLEIAGSLLEG